MYIASIKCNTVENGPGIRTSVFVSGCRSHCPNCHNPQAWDFNYGMPFNRRLKHQIIASLEKPEISGITILGGEPLEPENQVGVLNLIEKVRLEVPEKTIWLYTGFVWEDLMHIRCRACTNLLMKILGEVDVLVDGPFIEDLKDISLAYRGSSNQRFIKAKEILTTDPHKLICVDL